MTTNQEKQLKDLYYAVCAYLNEQDFEDSELIVEDIEKLVYKISKWISLKYPMRFLSVLI